MHACKFCVVVVSEHFVSKCFFFRQFVSVIIKIINTGLYVYLQLDDDKPISDKPISSALWQKLIQ